MARKVNLVGLLPLLTLILTVLVLLSCLFNELYWESSIQNPVKADVRKTIGLPSIAIGTNYGATRNPLLEVYCTALYDMPGGYCYIFIASFVGWPMQDPEYFKTVPGFNLKAMRG